MGELRRVLGAVQYKRQFLDNALLRSGYALATKSIVPCRPLC